MIRCLGLDRVELGVSDLKRSLRFYTDIVGLQAVDIAAAGTAALLCGETGCRVLLHAAPRPGFRVAGWRVDGERDLETLRARLQAARVPFEEVAAVDCQDRGDTAAVRLADPGSGALQEFHAVNAAVWRFEPTHTAIQRLGHVVFAVSEPELSGAFFRDILDFRESDRIEGATIFLRPSASPFHHGLGLGRAKHARMHHLNFMVSSLDDIGRALHRMQAYAVPVVFGPGRHPVSGSIFLYFLDPDGLTLEYSFGMETFEAVDPRRPTRWPAAPASLDTWGARRDPRLGAIGQIEQAVGSGSQRS